MVFSEKWEAPAARTEVKAPSTKQEVLGVLSFEFPSRLGKSVSLDAGTRRDNPYLKSMTKRLFDLTVSVLALILLLPLLLVIAFGVIVTSRGPVFFVQSRGGRSRRSFQMVKFRTMYVTANQGSVVQATRDDPRITPLGRILRKTSIDELPQLFNVLMGEMSIVGPRPHAIEHDEHYGLLIDSYHYRLACKPGLTGLAQVRGCRGATPKTEDMARRVEFDLKYIESGSLWLDLHIVLRTFWIMLTCRDAY